MTGNPHFESPESWGAAEPMLVFRPRVPTETAGFDLAALRVHVRDHRQRDLPMASRSLEAHYGGFVLSQSQPGEAEARRQALKVSYGTAPRDARIGGHEARIYELGPEPEPDDIDPRMPAVVVWHDSGMFYLVASDRMASEQLVGIAESIYR